MKRMEVPEEMDLMFLRDLKHRLKMTLRQIEQREKILKKEIKFVKGKKVPTAEQNKATENFYRTIHGKELS